MNLIRKVFDWGSGFWRYNFWSKIRPLYPRVLIINLTYKCNSRCVMCHIWKMRPKKELSQKDWETALQEPFFRRIRVLTISGGEAGLYPDYAKTVKSMVNKLPSLKRLVLNTNGFSPKVVKDVLKIADYCGLKKIKLGVTLSIDNVGLKHEEIRRVKGGFDKAIQTLDKLKEKIKNGTEIDLGVASVLMRKNVADYKKIRKYFGADKGVSHSFQLIGFHSSYVNNLGEKDKLDFENKSERKIIGFLKEMSQKNNLEAFYWNDMYEIYKNKRTRLTPCVFLKDGLVLDSLGDVYYCLSTRPIGNFIKEKRSVSEIYFDPKNIKFRREMEKTECRYCNSACEVKRSIAYDFTKYLIFRSKKLFSKKCC